MRGTQASTDTANGSQPGTGMPMHLEAVVVPVADVDRAKDFYGGLGWRMDGDFGGGEHRVVQMTPPASSASIVFGKGITSGRPGSIDRLLLTVEDIDAARDELRAHGADVSDVFHDAGGGLGGGWNGPEGRAPGPDPERRSYGTYATFSDPDGNVWLLQELTERLPGRVW